mgnify:CR=1 FL=1
MSSSCIIGTGIDIVENERMLEILRKWGAKFKDRVFLENEQKYCEIKADPCSHYAGRFAVKESVSKAFGTGISPHISWLDIEIVNAHLTGAPSVKFSRKAQKLADAHGVGDVLISLSHTRNYAIAHAFLVRKQS